MELCQVNDKSCLCVFSYKSIYLSIFNWSMWFAFVSIYIYIYIYIPKPQFPLFLVSVSKREYAWMAICVCPFVFLSIHQSSSEYNKAYTMKSRQYIHYCSALHTYLHTDVITAFTRQIIFQIRQVREMSSRYRTVTRCPLYILISMSILYWFLVCVHT